MLRKIESMWDEEEDDEDFYNCDFIYETKPVYDTETEDENDSFYDTDPIYDTDGEAAILEEMNFVGENEILEEIGVFEQQNSSPRFVIFFHLFPSKFSSDVLVTWENQMLKICNDYFCYNQIEGFNKSFVDMMRKYDDVSVLTDYDFSKDDFVGVFLDVAAIGCFKIWELFVVWKPWLRGIIGEDLRLKTKNRGRFFSMKGRMIRAWKCKDLQMMTWLVTWKMSVLGFLELDFKRGGQIFAMEVVDVFWTYWCSLLFSSLYFIAWTKFGEPLKL